jgi:protein-L-isoaspartate(D-aspartate) O-methyltransferase
MIDALALTPGSAVLHIGAGLGYYTALIAQCVGPSGHVTAVEVDHELAGEAARNLSSWPWVTVELADATRPLARPFDAILVNAGVTHPQDAWLDALVDGGRLIVPLTAAIPAMGSIGKGVMAMITRRAGDAFDARILTFTAIYSGVGAVRDSALNEQLGQALMRTPFPRLTRLRRDPHEASADCWLHGSGFCLSMH